MAKRELRQKPRQSVAIRGEKKRVKGDRDTDRDKLRRVREWAEKAKKQSRPCAWQRDCAAEVLAILNGTERKGEKR